MVSRAMRQIVLMGIICFGTIGMFNAMSSIGNAGRHSPTAQNLAITSSSIAYIIGFLLAGGTHNMIGPRLCVVFGGITFVLYAGSMMLAQDNDSSSVYPALAGILLGLGAGLIWVTQGAMMMSYPTEDNKGKYIACFFAIFNLGAVLGSVLPLALNSRENMDPDDVSSNTYIVYMVIMGVSTLLAVFLARPSTIVRDNGEPVTVAKFAGLKAEGLAILSVFCDWRMLLLIPAFFFSNFSYTYQFNDFNGFNFNIRTRSLNSLIFWVAQIIGALVIGYLLDRIPVKRPKRAKLGLLVIALLFMATWIAALMMQLKHKWERKALQRKELIDYGHGTNYTGLLAIYAMFGFCDAAFAVYCYWLMGALSNKHDELSRYAGFFKSIQSLGSAVAAPLDLAQTPLLAYLITNWILCAISIATMFLVSRTISDTTIDDDEDEDGDEEDYEYDDQELEAGEASSCGTSDVRGQSETHSHGQGVKEHSNSFEGDMSTICATSDVGKAALDSRSSGQPSAHWRNSSRTSGHQDEYQDQGAQHLRSLDTRLASGDQSPAASYPLAPEETTFPSRTYQQHHQQPSDRNAYLLAGMPAMAEVQHRPVSGVGSAYWAEQPLSRAGSSHSSFFPQFQPSISEPSAPTPSSSSARPPTQFPTPMYMQGSSTSAQPQPPSLVISDDSSLPVPLFNYPPAHLYLHPPWPEENAVHGDLAPDLGGLGAMEAGHNPAAIGYLLPHEPLDEALRRASSGSSTRYDDDQEMDSIDTHSITSMSSGHDSIPEMTEMTDVPRGRDT
ncbi:hypothetical protein KVV02_001734 [Mortierella alpina]|uniref:Major facilitator superfamily (MFS) profile domain-containing protein n=1 Tax=Mortierella alpina TaxID=64518 RepID=A0A9P7ZYZ5_MORAP|nr:hypothetical protein KVV02_001734 [Mortierella alpina]